MQNHVIILMYPDTTRALAPGIPDHVVLYFFGFSLRMYSLILEGEEGRERNISLVASCTHPDWGLNPQPFWCTFGVVASVN